VAIVYNDSIPSMQCSNLSLILSASFSYDPSAGRRPLYLHQQSTSAKPEKARRSSYIYKSNEAEVDQLRANHSSSSIPNDIG
jgi:hypothetical protein